MKRTTCLFPNLGQHTHDAAYCQATLSYRSSLISALFYSSYLQSIPSKERWLLMLRRVELLSRHTVWEPEDVHLPGMYLADGVVAPPLLGAEFERVKWRNRFTEPSVYRGLPSTELEEAWDYITKRPFLSWSLRFPS